MGVGEKGAGSGKGDGGVRGGSARVVAGYMRATREAGGGGGDAKRV